MGRPPRSALLGPKQRLAALIRTAMSEGHRHDRAGPCPEQPWTQKDLAHAVSADRTTVAGWRSRGKPQTPPIIVTLLDVFYGTRPHWAAARDLMLDAWRRAKDTLDDETPSSPRMAVSAKFADFVEVADLTVSPPLTGYAPGNLDVPYSPRIVPGMTSAFAERSAEIGLAGPLLAIESRHWQPTAESIFRNKDHDDT